MAEVEIVHRFTNPQPDDAGPHTYTKPSDWNANELFVGGGPDGDLITWNPASSTMASYRTLVGTGGVTITVHAGTIEVSTSGSAFIDGAGTAGVIPKFMDANTLTNSIMDEAAGQITVTGDAKITGTLFVNDIQGFSPLTITAPAADKQALVVKGFDSQSEDIFQIRNSSDEIQLALSAAGLLHVFDKAQIDNRLFVNKILGDPHIEFNFLRSGSPEGDATRAVLLFANNLVGGSTGGTFLGLHVSAGNGADFINFQQEGVSFFKLDDDLNLTLSGTLFVNSIQGFSPLVISSPAADQQALVVKGFSGQTENIFVVQDSDANTLVSVGAEGTVSIGEGLPLFGTGLAIKQVTPEIALRSADLARIASLVLTGTRLYLGTATPTIIDIGVNSGNAIRVSLTNQVGIGNFDPVATLTVGGTFLVTGDATFNGEVNQVGAHFITSDPAGGVDRGIKFGSTALRTVLYDDGGGDTGSAYIDMFGAAATNTILTIRTKGSTGQVRFNTSTGLAVVPFWQFGSNADGYAVRVHGGAEALFAQFDSTNVTRQNILQMANAQMTLQAESGPLNLVSKTAAVTITSNNALALTIDASQNATFVGDLKVEDTLFVNTISGFSPVTFLSDVTIARPVGDPVLKIVHGNVVLDTGVGSSTQLYMTTGATIIAAIQVNGGSTFFDYTGSISFRDAGGSGSERLRLASDGSLNQVGAGFITSDPVGGTDRGIKFGSTALRTVLYDDGSGSAYIDMLGAGATNANLTLRSKGSTGQVVVNSSAGLAVGVAWVFGSNADGYAVRVHGGPEALFAQFDSTNVTRQNILQMANAQMTLQAESGPLNLVSTTGSVLLKSANVTALTLDTSQNATFAGKVNINFTGASSGLIDVYNVGDDVHVLKLTHNTNGAAQSLAYIDSVDADAVYLTVQNIGAGSTAVVVKSNNSGRVLSLGAQSRDSSPNDGTASENVSGNGYGTLRISKSTPAGDILGFLDFLGLNADGNATNPGSFHFTAPAGNTIGGGSGSNQVYLGIGGVFTAPVASDGVVFLVGGNMTAALNRSAYGAYMSTVINRTSTGGTHPLIAGLRIFAPDLGVGTDAIDEATTLYISGAPTAGTERLALHVAAGNVKINGTLFVNSISGFSPITVLTGMLLPDGTQAAPSYSSSTIPGSGMYFSSAPAVFLGLQNVEYAALYNGGFRIGSSIQFRAQDGAPGNPGISFDGNHGTGLRHGGGGLLEIDTNASLAVSIDASQNATFLGDVRINYLPATAAVNTVLDVYNVTADLHNLRLIHNTIGAAQTFTYADSQNGDDVIFSVQNIGTGNTFVVVRSNVHGRNLALGAQQRDLIPNTGNSSELIVGNGYGTLSILKTNPAGDVLGGLSFLGVNADGNATNPGSFHFGTPAGNTIGGGSGSNQVYLGIGGVFTAPAASDGVVFLVGGNMNAALNRNAYGAYMNTVINRTSTGGTHPLIAGLRIFAPDLGIGTDAIDEATTLYITGAPTAGTARYALHVAAGNVKVGGYLGVNGAVGGATIIDQIAALNVTGFTALDGLRISGASATNTIVSAIGIEIHAGGGGSGDVSLKSSVTGAVLIAVGNLNPLTIANVTNANYVFSLGNPASVSTKGLNLRFVAGPALGPGNFDGGDIYVDGGTLINTGLDGNVKLASVRGLVGVGVGTPTSLLHVFGDAKVTGTLYVNSVSGFSPVEFLTTLLAPDGDEATPSYALASEPGTGFYKFAAGRLGLSIAGTYAGDFANDGGIGIISAGIFFVNTPAGATNDIFLSPGGGDCLILASLDQTIHCWGRVQSNFSGSASDPNYGLDVNSGFYLIDVGIIGITTAGTLAVTIDASQNATFAGALEVGTTLKLDTQPAFAAGDKYVIIDASGNIHVSALGPAS